MNEEVTAKEVFGRDNYRLMAKHLPPLVLHVLPRVMAPRQGEVKSSTRGDSIAVHKLARTKMTAAAFYSIISAILGESGILKRNIKARPAIILVDASDHQKMLRSVEPFGTVEVNLSDLQNDPIHSSVALTREELDKIKDMSVEDGRKSEILLKRKLTPAEYQTRFRDAVIKAYGDGVARELWRIAKERAGIKATG